jgi:hypothetical protein
VSTPQEIRNEKLRLGQGCQMVCFHTKNPNFGYILEDLGLENIGMLAGHLEFFTVIWYFFPRIGLLNQEKSGNPGLGGC